MGALVIDDRSARVALTVWDDAPPAHPERHVDYAVEIEFEVRGTELRGKAQTILDDVNGAIKGLRQLHEAMDGTCTLRDVGDDFSMTFVAKKDGSLNVTSRFRGRYPDWDLNFRIELDQSHLLTIANDLRELRQ